MVSKRHNQELCNVSYWARNTFSVWNPSLPPITNSSHGFLYKKVHCTVFSNFKNSHMVSSQNKHVKKVIVSQVNDKKRDGAEMRRRQRKPAALWNRTDTVSVSFILSTHNPLVNVLNVLRQRNESRRNVSPAEWSTTSIPTRWDLLQRKRETRGGKERETDENE